MILQPSLVMARPRRSGTFSNSSTNTTGLSGGMILWLWLADTSLKKVMYRHPVTSVLHAQPAHVTEAMRGPDAQIWRESMEKEIAAMTQFNVWEDVLDIEIPAGTKLLGTMGAKNQERSKRVSGKVQKPSCRARVHAEGECTLRTYEHV